MLSALLGSNFDYRSTSIDSTWAGGVSGLRSYDPPT